MSLSLALNSSSSSCYVVEITMERMMERLMRGRNTEIEEGKSGCK
jgi:hypothetical protein